MIDGLAVKVPRSMFACASLFTFTFSLEFYCMSITWLTILSALPTRPAGKSFPFPQWTSIVDPARLDPTLYFISAFESAKGEDSHQTPR